MFTETVILFSYPNCLLQYFLTKYIITVSLAEKIA
jgi:hypothetical protein